MDECGCSGVSVCCSSTYPKGTKWKLCLGRYKLIGQIKTSKCNNKKKNAELHEGAAKQVIIYYKPSKRPKQTRPLMVSAVNSEAKRFVIYREAELFRLLVGRRVSFHSAEEGTLSYVVRTACNTSTKVKAIKYMNN